MLKSVSIQVSPLTLILGSCTSFDHFALYNFVSCHLSFKIVILSFLKDNFNVI